MNTILSLVVLLLAFTGNFIIVNAQNDDTIQFPQGVTSQCLDDVMDGGTSDGSYPSCGAQDLKFLRVTDTIVVDQAVQDSCNCDCHVYQASPIPITTDTSCPACNVPLADGEISCTFEGKVYEQGTVFAACLGDDDYVTFGLTVDFEAGGGSTDVGIYIAADGGELDTLYLLKFAAQYLQILLTLLAAHILCPRIGNAMTGQCDLSLLKTGNYTGIGGKTLFVGEWEGQAFGPGDNEVPDNCNDFQISSATDEFHDYEMDPVTVLCIDTDGDGYLE
jgi:hypothetical protein